MIARSGEENSRSGVDTPSPCFSQEYDSMGVRGWGSAKNIILKELKGERPGLTDVERKLRRERESGQARVEGGRGT